MKLWGGRFQKETDRLVEEFNASLRFDQRLALYDILGSQVHVQMLARQGMLQLEEADLIVNGLSQLKNEITEGKIIFEGAEDIHSFVEQYVIRKVGPVGGKMHTARSRNDQVALDIRLYLRDEILNTQRLLTHLLNSLLQLAEQYKSVIMPGYTHLQRAQPVTFGHHLLAYYFKFKRDYERLQDNLKRVNILPLGSGALAGTTFPIDRVWVAAELQFAEVCQNSIDGVSDRDFIVEFLSVAATLMMHFSGFCEELILWSTNEFAFVELDDAYTTGSSIMPQKKNPDVAELTRGKTGRVYGHLIQLLTTLKGLPLAYNKDLQEDKEGLFDTIDTIQVVLRIFPDMLLSMTVNERNMKKAASQGFVNATDLADYLAKKGLPFRQAHEVVGKAVLYAIETGVELEEIDLVTWKNLFPELANYFTEEIYNCLQIAECVERRNSDGGTSPSVIEAVIQQENNWIKLVSA